MEYWEAFKPQYKVSSHATLRINLKSNLSSVLTFDTQIVKTQIPTKTDSIVEYLFKIVRQEVAAYFLTPEPSSFQLPCSLKSSVDNPLQHDYHYTLRVFADEQYRRLLGSASPDQCYFDHAEILELGCLFDFQICLTYKELVQILSNPPLQKREVMTKCAISLMNSVSEQAIHDNHDVVMKEQGLIKLHNLQAKTQNPWELELSNHMHVQLILLDGTLNMRENIHFKHEVLKNRDSHGFYQEIIEKFDFHLRKSCLHPVEYQYSEIYIDEFEQQNYLIQFFFDKRQISLNHYGEIYTRNHRSDLDFLSLPCYAKLVIFLDPLLMLQSLEKGKFSDLDYDCYEIRRQKNELCRIVGSKSLFERQLLRIQSMYPSRDLLHKSWINLGIPLSFLPDPRERIRVVDPMEIIADQQELEMLLAEAERDEATLRQHASDALNSKEEAKKGDANQAASENQNAAENSREDANTAVFAPSGQQLATVIASNSREEVKVGGHAAQLNQNDQADSEMQDVSGSNEDNRRPSQPSINLSYDSDYEYDLLQHSRFKIDSDVAITEATNLIGGIKSAKDEKERERLTRELKKYSAEVLYFLAKGYIEWLFDMNITSE